MTTTVTLEYRRIGNSMSSSGRILSDENGLITEEGQPFDGFEFKRMMGLLANVLGNWPPEQEVEVLLQRTDHEGLLPYKLDAKTVTLFRTDPVAAIAAFGFPTQSVSNTVARVQRDRAPRVQPSIRAGHDTLADAFGDQLYFKVRKHELECPGCGYWGMFASPSLLAAPERAGECFKTAFVCPKKCGGRFLVTCLETWGYVDTKYLLERTKLDAFYFPRAWNEGKPWVSRESLQQKYNAYSTEKEKVTCSETAVGQ